MSSFWDSEANVDQYEKLADGYDGAELVAYLQTVLDSGSTVLELGMGPGKDLDMLRRTYDATGSDVSSIFLDRYRARHPDADLLLLDAVALDTERTFDAIYSNKVLQHLTRDDMRASLQRQAQLVRPGGLLLHALWYGDQVEEHMGLRFTQYTEALVSEVLPPRLSVVSTARYREMEDGDSLRVHLAVADA